MDISYKDQSKLWTQVAIHSFGGPAGQIAVIHKLVVEDKKLISEEKFLHALNFCMLLPGPEAQQLATYMGWLMGRWRGGLIAGGLFILPGFLSILLLSYLYVLYQELTIVHGIFYGLKPAIIAIVSAALLRISKKSLIGMFHWTLAVLAFFSLFFFNVPFPLVVVFAGLFGMLYGRIFPSTQPEKMKVPLPPIKDLFKTGFVWCLIWSLPILLVLLVFGPSSTFHSINIFFSNMSLVTFGGAYAALSYVAQRAVDVFGWLQGTEMLDGLGMAETTPGPLIQVVQFVGFMGAYRFSDVSSPLMAAFIGSVLSTWMTFAPCFLWIFTFAPYVEFIRGHKVFSDALSAITSSVVGVIFNLSLWFVLKALFKVSHRYINFPLDFEYPEWSSLDFSAGLICIVALVLQFCFKCRLFTILGCCTSLGILFSYIK